MLGCIFLHVCTDSYRPDCPTSRPARSRRRRRSFVPAPTTRQVCYVCIVQYLWLVKAMVNYYRSDSWLCCRGISHASRHNAVRLFLSIQLFIYDILLLSFSSWGFGRIKLSTALDPDLAGLAVQRQQSATSHAWRPSFPWRAMPTKSLRGVLTCLMAPYDCVQADEGFPNPNRPRPRPRPRPMEVGLDGWSQESADSVLHRLDAMRGPLFSSYRG